MQDEKILEALANRHCCSRESHQPRVSFVVRKFFSIKQQAGQVVLRSLGKTLELEFRRAKRNLSKLKPVDAANIGMRSRHSLSLPSRLVLLLSHEQLLQSRMQYMLVLHDQSAMPLLSHHQAGVLQTNLTVLRVVSKNNSKDSPIVRYRTIYDVPVTINTVLYDF